MNGKRQLDNIQREIQRTVNETVPIISKSIAKTGKVKCHFHKDIT